MQEAMWADVATEGLGRAQEGPRKGLRSAGGVGTVWGAQLVVR